MAYLEVIIAAFAAFMVGFAWYTALFGKAWQAETGISDEAAQQNMLRTHGLAFLMLCVIAFAINMIIGFHEPKDQTLTHGAFHGVMAVLMYCVPAVAIHYLYQRKSLKLFAIDAGYIVVFGAVMGGVLGALNL